MVKRPKPDPPDDRLLTPEWVMAALPTTKPHCLGAEHQGPRGRIDWQMDRRGDAFVLWANGGLFPWKEATRGHLRSLCAAFGIALTEPPPNPR